MEETLPESEFHLLFQKLGHLVLECKTLWTRDVQHGAKPNTGNFCEAGPAPLTVFIFLFRENISLLYYLSRLLTNLSTSALNGS